MTTTRLLRPYLRRQWRALAVAAVSSVVVAGAELARPFPLKLVIDRLLDGDRTRPFHLTDADLRLVAAVGALVIVIALLEAVASYAIDVRLQRAGERIVHDLRVATYGQLQRLSLAFHDRRPTGDLVTRVTGDVNAIGTLFSESLGTVATAAVLLIGMLAVSVSIDPVLALAAFAVTPLLAEVTRRFRHTQKTISRRQRANEGEIASLASEALSAMREVKAFGSEHFEEERLLRRSEEAYEAGVEAAHVEGRFTGAIDVTGAIGSAVVLVLGVFRVSSGHLSPGDLVVMYSYVRRLYRPLRDIARQSSRVSRAMARGDRVAEVLAADQVLEDRPDAHDGPRAAGDVELAGVHFSYQPGRPALRGLSLRVPAGQRLAIVGPSGAGKSTVAALLARFYDPDEGRVLIDGRDCRDCSLAWLRDQVGLVLQDTVLFTGTVQENIAYGTVSSAEQVVSAAKAAGADAFVSQLPLGYDTVLGPRGVGLSGGQRQRIGIARTLLRDPPVLILDEPTTGLDAESESEVLAGLDALMRDRTVIVVTHSLALAGTAQRVAVLEEGRVTQEGAPGELLATLGTFRRLAERQGLGVGVASRSPVPRDDALPAMGRLLDAASMAPVLAASMRRGAAITDVHVHCLRYKPGTNLVVHYDVAVDGAWHHATAMIAEGDHLARRARRREHLALARRVDGRAPAARPLAYDRKLGALIQWLPLDLALPALAEPPAELRRRLRQAGVRVGASGEAPTLLNYKPRRRAVLGLGRHVVKIYASPDDYARAVATLLAVGDVDAFAHPMLEAAVPDLRLTVQSRLPGRRPTRPMDAAADAGALLAAIHATPAGELSVLSPQVQLAEAGRSARLVGAIVPALAPRAERLMADLETARPAIDRMALAHGDFHAGQLLSGRGAMAVIDLDEMAVAPPALDLATYAAHAVRGPTDDASAAAAALAALVDGYGKRPEALSWYVATAILRRAPFPFRYLDDQWPVGVEAMLGASEAALRS